MKTLASNKDQSVNFIIGESPNILETRYVRRDDKYFVIYLSSQTGCKQACRMCYLTATKQTKPQDAGWLDFADQANTVYNHYDKQTGAKAEIVHYDFMARGEPLENKSLLDPNGFVLGALYEMAKQKCLFPRFNISTIMPKSLEGQKLHHIFSKHIPDFYYSIYSVKPSFRKKWLPNAMSVYKALAMLKEWQDVTKKIIKLHWAFIKDENDSEEDVTDLASLIVAYELRVDINIVRYNPYSKKYGEESNDLRIEINKALLTTMLPRGTKVEIIDRVGEDCYASCGMFIGK